MIHNMENKMKRYASIELIKKLNELKSDRKYSKFLLLSIIKTLTELEKIKKEAEEKEMALYSEEYKTFTNSRLSLLKVYSEKDEEGKPIVEQDQVKISEDNKEEFETEFKKLLELNKEVVEKFNSDSKEFQTWIEEDVEVKITKVDFKYLPEELFVEEYNTLSYLLEGEDTID